MHYDQSTICDGHRHNCDYERTIGIVKEYENKNYTWINVVIRFSIRFSG